MWRCCDPVRSACLAQGQGVDPPAGPGAVAPVVVTVPAADLTEAVRVGQGAAALVAAPQAPAERARRGGCSGFQSAEERFPQR